MTWDILDGKEQDYIEFAVGELGPKLRELGLQIDDVWYTIVGEGPEMVLSGLMNTRSDAEALFATADWSGLEERLRTYVLNIKIKFVKPKGGFQL